MFTYAEHFGVDRVALVYPGARPQVQGKFAKSEAEADLIWVSISKGNISAWMREIGERFGEWVE